MFIIFEGEQHDFSKMAEKVVQYCDDALKEVSKAMYQYNLFYCIVMTRTSMN